MRPIHRRLCSPIPNGMMPDWLPLPTLGVRAAIRKQVVAVFNDRQRGEAPVVRSEKALFPPQSVIWRVHGDVGSMMVGGIASLLLQMLHPSVLAGIWDHSNFRQDMHGRFRRTARFIALTTYGERELALAAIARVRTVHDAVTGCWTAHPMRRTIPRYSPGFMLPRRAAFSTPGYAIVNRA